jgi:hypothetical protein
LREGKGKWTCPAAATARRGSGETGEDRIGGIGDAEEACRAIGPARRRGAQPGAAAFSRVKIGATRWIERDFLKPFRKS